jgi:uncharacterized protein
MNIVTDFPHKIREIEHVDVPMPDGCRLGARIWMPEGAEDAPVPAILEYIPYRKNDLCAPEDEATGTYLAGHGYAYVRLDLRGAGDSEGLMLDEYLEQELQDGCDAIAWIAGQPWCDGGVGIIGISWGGFNGLQIAALQPPALKAVITVCSTDDRYADDVHYMGGCLLIDNISWAAQMFARNTLPPDPLHRGEDWRKLWMERLDKSGLWLNNWLEHQTRDGFWQHGSVCEDYARIQVPVYAVSGWADGYCRSVLRLVENLAGPRKGLIGPWAHTYPHVGKPGPAIGFLQETLRWWDHWLQGRDTGIMDEPQLRLFMQDPVAPRGGYAERPGRWIGEPSWPSPNVARTLFALGSDGRLVQGKADLPDAHLTICSPLDVGMSAGKWCSYAKPGDQPPDQRLDDGGSLVFETEPLGSALEIAGDPAVDLAFTVDRPVAQVAVRLVDVAPDGAATRVTYGVFNLTHRNSHEHPDALEPGRQYRVRIPMKPVAQRFVPGHRIRLAVSTNYFPLTWPAPERVTMTLLPGDTILDLPLRTASADDAKLAPFGAPEAGPGPEIERIETAPNGWRVIRDHATNTATAEIADGAGTHRLVARDITVTKRGRERYSVANDDPASLTGYTEWNIGLSRGEWATRSLTETTLTSDARNFRIQARLRAWLADDLVFERTWDELIPRKFV